MNVLKCSVVGFVLVATSVEAVPIEWTTSSGGNGHLYEAVLVGSAITWEDAQAAAVARGPSWNLATITSAAENAFVENLFSSDSSFFNCCAFPFPLGHLVLPTGGLPHHLGTEIIFPMQNLVSVCKWRGTISPRDTSWVPNRISWKTQAPAKIPFPSPPPCYCLVQVWRV